MPFVPANLIPIGRNPSPGVKIWSYVSTTDTLTTVLGASYINRGSIDINAGDIMIVRGSDNAALAQVGSVDGSGNVTLAVTSADLGAHTHTLASITDAGDLAALNEVSVSDIDATGTPSSATFLRGDGAWATPSGGGGPGSGMDAGVYDPQNISADAFSRANHTGTQTVSTISGLGALATLSQVTNTQLAASTKRLPVISVNSNRAVLQTDEDGFMLLGSGCTLLTLNTLISGTVVIGKNVTGSAITLSNGTITGSGPTAVQAGEGFSLYFRTNAVDVFTAPAP